LRERRARSIGTGGELGTLPRWLGQVYDLDLPEHFTTLIRVLQDQSRQKRVAMMAPEPPADFVVRPAEFNALKKRTVVRSDTSATAANSSIDCMRIFRTAVSRVVFFQPETFPDDPAITMRKRRG
jgi:hypothetical protein